MEMTGSQSLPVSQEIAWKSLNDPNLLQQSIAGCDKIETIAPNEFLAVVTAAVGPVRARFQAKLFLEDINAPHSYTLRFDGQGGIAGFGTGQATVRLSAIDAHNTQLEYAVKAQVGGKLAQLGSRLIDATANKMAGDFFTRFNEVLQAQYPTSAIAPTPAAPIEGTSHDLSTPALYAVAGGLVVALALIALGLSSFASS